MTFKAILTPAACAVGLTLASAAVASNPGGVRAGGPMYLGNGVFTYEVFERAVDHADLENCPKEFDSEANFCRLTVAAEMAHVFVFSYDGDQPLLAVKSYELNDRFLPF